MLKIKRFRVSVIIEAENMVAAAARFSEITKDSIQIKQITRLPTTEARMVIRRKLESVLGKLDESILETLFTDENYSLAL